MWGTRLISIFLFVRILLLLELCKDFPLIFCKHSYVLCLPFFSCDGSFQTEWKIKHWKFISWRILKIDETLSTLNDILNTWNCRCGSYEVKQRSYLWFISSRRLYIKTAGRAIIWSRMNPANRKMPLRAKVDLKDVIFLQVKASPYCYLF